MKPVDEILQHITLPFTLHPYQVTDINRFADKDTCGIYWDMGLGKMLCGTMLGVYKLLKGANSVMTIVPSSLITEWQEWLESLNLAVTAYRGTPKQREKLSLDSDFIILSPQIFQRDYEKLKQLKSLYFCVDEATNLCEISNLIYKMTRGGTKTRKEKIKLESGLTMERPLKTHFERLMHSCCLLTGTPLSSNPLAAYGLIAITSPKRYSSYYQFCRKHVAMEDSFGKPIKFKGLEDIHLALTENASIRAVGDHLQLPEKIVKVVRYSLSPGHMKLYKRLLNEQLLTLDSGAVIDATEATKMFHLLQQFIFSPAEFSGKIEGLEVLDSLIKDTKSRILFNNYIATNELMMKRYNAGGCFGSVSPKAKEKYVKDFKSGDLDTITIHPKSGGYGLNLFNCNQVIFPEMPLAPRDYKQCLARSWRQGQTRTVVITVLVAKGTIQETLLQGIMSKDDVVSKVLHTKDTLRKMLTGEL